MNLPADNLAYLSSLITANLDPTIKEILFKQHTLQVENKQPDTLVVPQNSDETPLE